MLDVSVAGVEITEVETDDGTGATIRTTKYTRTIPVPGSFAYQYDNNGTWTSLSAGDKLDAGNYEIRVTFTTSALGLTVDGTSISFAGAPHRKSQFITINRGDPLLTWEPNQVDFYLLRNADCPSASTNATVSSDADAQGSIKYYIDGAESTQLNCEVDSTITTTVRATYVPNDTENYKDAYLDVAFTVRKPKAEQPMRMFNGLVQKFSCNMGWGGDSVCYTHLTLPTTPYV